MEQVLLGFMTAAFLFLIGSGIYVGWRYVYKPWRIIRADLLILAKRQEAFENEIRTELGARKAISLSNEDLARLERESRMNTLRKAIESGGVLG